MPGTRHADAFAESVKHSGRLNELTLMPKSTGLFNIVGQLKTLPSALNMARAGKLPPIIHKAIPGVERIKKIFNGSEDGSSEGRVSWPGCVSKGACPELYVSAQAIAEPLGLELHELVSAPCTGAGVLSEQNPDLGDALNGLTLAMAETEGADLMTICSTCQGVLATINHNLEKRPARLETARTRRSPTKAFATADDHRQAPACGCCSKTSASIASSARSSAS